MPDPDPAMNLGSESTTLSRKVEIKNSIKILYENADKNKKYLDAEIIKTTNLCYKIVCRPPQSRETIPLRILS